MRLIATVDQLRQHDGQLAVVDGRLCCPDVEGSAQPDGAREAAELALDQVKGMVLSRARRRLLSGDQQHPGPKEHAEGSGGNAAHIDDHLDRLVCFEYVKRRMTLSRVRPLL